MAREEAVALGEKLISAGQERSKELFSGQQRLERLLNVRGVPSREEVEELTNQIESLSAKIDSLIDEKDINSHQENYSTTLAE